MASSNFLQRIVLVLLPAASLVSCVGDGAAPPTEVGAAQPGLSSRARLEGRVGDRELLGPVGAPAAYAPEPVPRGRASAAIDYLDTPNLAGLDSGADEDPLGVNDPRGATSDEAISEAEPGAPVTAPGRQASLREQALRQPMPQGGAYEIPTEGVNIDAELGVGGENVLGVGEAAPQAQGAPVAAQILVPQGPMAIAEGQTSQPVVDGIGTDNPVPLLAPREQAADPTL
jgi:hypothetical protein